MRILRMGSSQETNPAIAPECRVGAVAQRMLEESTGLSFETVSKAIWPTPDLPDVVDRWMQRYEPSVVVLVTNGFWYTYDSAMWRLQQKIPLLTPAFRPVVQLSFYDWFAQNAVFRMLRRTALRTVGGAPFFTPTQVVEATEAALRRVVAYEPEAVMVRSGYAVAQHSTRANRAECALRRNEVNQRLGAICERLHVTLVGRDDDPMEGEDRRYHLRDLMHWNEAGHARQGEKDGRSLIELWRRSHQDASVAPAPTPG